MAVNPIREPEEDEPWRPSQTSPSQQAPKVRPALLSGSSKALPLVYGTTKVPLILVEKLAPVKGDYPAWLNSTAYWLGARVTSDGSVYECITAGTSSFRNNPRGDGASIQDGTVVWKFIQREPMPIYAHTFIAAVCEGAATRVLRWWKEDNVYTVESPGTYFRGLTLSVGPDGGGQTIPVWFGDDVGGYQHTALVSALNPMNFGTAIELPDMAVELQGQLFGVTSLDVNPADIILDIVTHARRGCGLSADLLSSSVTGSAAGTYRTYCDAVGLRLSLYLDAQQTVLQLLESLLLATNSEACFSEGVIKIRPLGDEPTTAPEYGAVNYVPDVGAAYNLSTDDFVDQDQPVQVRCKSDGDAYNVFPVEYTDREAGYDRITVENPDIGDINDRGVLVASTVSLPFTFADGTKPTMLSRIYAQCSCERRREYTFSLPWKYVLLEPLDVVTLTEPATGLYLTPVRIRSIDEEGDVLRIVAEDYPAGMAAARGYQPQTSTGYIPQEDSTLDNLPTVVDGLNVGFETAIVGPGGTNHALDPANYVPNGEFGIWSPPRQQSSSPPDCWTPIGDVGGVVVVDPPVGSFDIIETNLSTEAGQYTGAKLTMLTGYSAGVSTTILLDHGSGLFELNPDLADGFNIGDVLKVELLEESIDAEATWAASGAGTVWYDGTTQLSGDIAMLARVPAANGGSVGLISSNKFMRPVAGLELYKLVAQFRASGSVGSSADPHPTLEALWYTADKTYISSTLLDLVPLTANTWLDAWKPALAPSTARWVRFRWRVPYSTQFSTSHIDKLLFAPMPVLADSALTTAETITWDGVYTRNLNFSQQIFDPAGLMSGTPRTATIKHSGTYELGISAEVTPDARTSYLHLMYSVNGSYTDSLRDSREGSFTTKQHMHLVVSGLQLKAGDVVAATLMVVSSGGSTTVTVSADKVKTRFTLRRID